MYYFKDDMENAVTLCLLICIAAWVLFSCTVDGKDVIGSKLNNTESTLNGVATITSKDGDEMERRRGGGGYGYGYGWGWGGGEGGSGGGGVVWGWGRRGFPSWGRGCSRGANPNPNGGQREGAQHHHHRGHHHHHHHKHRRRNGESNNNKGVFKLGVYALCLRRGRCMGMKLNCPLQCGGHCSYDCHYTCRAFCSVSNVN